MGRAGAGAGGGGRASSGGKSAGRTGGGHRVGTPSNSGSRAGSRSFSGGSAGRSRSFSGGTTGRSSGSSMPRGGYRVSGGNPGVPPRSPGRMRPGMSSPPPRRMGPGMPPPPPRYMGPGMPPPPPRKRQGGYPPHHGSGRLITAIVLFIIIIFAILMLQRFDFVTGKLFTSSLSSQNSTIVREKLDTNNAYINDCIIDELGWFDSVSKTESQLKNFWEKTGVQPYIILRNYDAELTTDSEKEQWALNYYEENFDTENIFLFVYFAEEDTENDVGYMAYANGYQTSSVMDSEAVEIFWNNIDKYWYTNLSTDDVVINAFNDTASTIMHVSTTGKDILKWILIVIAIILLGIIIINLVKQKYRRAKEKAEEDQRILNTPIHDIAKDDLEDKYL